MSVIDYSDKIRDFFKRYYWDDILVLANDYPDVKSLQVDFADLDQFNDDVAEALRLSPDKLIQDFETVLREIDIPVEKSLESAHVRFYNIPSRIPIRDIRQNHLEQLIAVEGIIRRVTEVRPKYKIAAFKCVFCDHLNYVPQDDQILTEPYDCENETCNNTKGIFVRVDEQSTFTDAQHVLIQESPENVKGSSQPQSLEVYIEDDIAGILKPGDRVVLSGIIKSHLRTKGNKKTPFNEITLHCNHIELLDEDYDDVEISPEEEGQIKELSRNPLIYSMFRDSIAPSICGYDDIKEALYLQLFGGVAKFHPDSSRTRGDIHILLVGDPGIAKSQLLRYMVKVSPRGIFTSGKSSSAAGLTAAAVKDSFTGRWEYEAGAFPMADGGMISIDEMDKMSESDTSAMHEGMEQQTITIQKAGISVTLASRCACLGAANPKYGRFNPYDSIVSQVDMPAPLISRFDQIFIMKDTPDELKDELISSHILQSHKVGEMSQNFKSSFNPVHSQQEIDGEISAILPPVDPEFMRKYVAYARRNIFPIMDSEAIEHIKQFYKDMRAQRSKESDALPVTARQLEALVRLAEASAKLRLSDTATIEDAKRATRITEACLREVATDPTTGKVDADLIYSGTSASQRDKIHGLTELMRQMSEESDSGRIYFEMLKQKALNMGFSGPEFEGVIKKMKNQGDLMQVNAKEVRLV